MPEATPSAAVAASWPEPIRNRTWPPCTSGARVISSCCTLVPGSDCRHSTGPNGLTGVSRTEPVSPIEDAHSPTRGSAPGWSRELAAMVVLVVEDGVVAAVRALEAGVKGVRDEEGPHAAYPTVPATTAAAAAAAVSPRNRWRRRARPLALTKRTSGRGRASTSCRSVAMARRSWASSPAVQSSCSAMAALLVAQGLRQLGAAPVQARLDGACGGVGLVGDLVDAQVADVVQGHGLPDRGRQRSQRGDDRDPVLRRWARRVVGAVALVGAVLGRLLAPPGDGHPARRRAHPRQRVLVGPDRRPLLPGPRVGLLGAVL